MLYNLIGYIKYKYLKNFGTYDQKLEIDRLENAYDYNALCKSDGCFDDDVDSD